MYAQGEGGGLRIDEGDLLEAKVVSYEYNTCLPPSVKAYFGHNIRNGRCRFRGGHGRSVEGSNRNLPPLYVTSLVLKAWWYPLHLSTVTQITREAEGTASGLFRNGCLALLSC